MTSPRQSGVRVLMIGWEFPPFITGGLGTACYGLTRAMDRRGMQVTFVLPKPTEGETAEHVRLMSPGKPSQPPSARTRDSSGPSNDVVHVEPAESAAQEQGQASEVASDPEDLSSSAPSQPHEVPSTAEPFTEPFRHVRFIGIPADAFPVYEPPMGEREADDDEVAARVSEAGERGEDASEDDGRSQDAAAPSGAKHTSKPASSPDAPRSESARDRHSHQAHASPRSPQQPPSHEQPQQKPADTDYDGDIMTIVDRYAEFCLEQCRDLDFDVIHVHDWMTYPAGMRVARATGKPLVAHIHSTEFDRSGEHVNSQIYDIERRGMQAAMRIIAVSQLTKNVVINKYHVSDERIEVVYNGVNLEPSAVGITGIRSKDKIVLYFGRITYQKGPEYFIKAAKRVLDVMPDVKFVVAGSGDLAKRMIEMAAELGIGHKVLFTGFLRGHDIKRVFNLADLYVMPSISEPFGIAPLEAMSHNVPVLISRSSGVSEVLNHALKVDFWDVDDMANKIVAVLRHPPLSEMLKEHGAFEVRRLTWDGAAERCEQVYRAVQSEMPQSINSTEA